MTKTRLAKLWNRLEKAQAALRAALEKGASAAVQPERDMRCIAPGCRRRSKGPRFHYLCDKHRQTAKKIDWETWRAARRGR